MSHKQSDINDNYPLLSYRFKARIGETEVFFSELSGLNMEHLTTEYKAVSPEGVKTTQLIEQGNAPNLTLKRGLFKNGEDLYRWFKGGQQPDLEKKEVVVNLLGPDHNVIMRWTVSNAFASKFEGSVLDAKSNDVIFQTIELKGDLMNVKGA